jgi:hypothetical protein
MHGVIPLFPQYTSMAWRLVKKRTGTILPLPSQNCIGSDHSP